MVFHTFGDSHAEWAWSKIEGIKTHALHGTLCYSFGRDKLVRLNIANEEYYVKPHDNVCFLFGEIDCSCHVHKYITQTKSYKKVIEELTQSYFEAIQVNVNQINALKVYVCSIPPAVEKEKVHFEPDENGRLWLEHRFQGTDEERKQYVLYFNMKVKELCEIFGYHFFDIHDKYTDENGFLNRELSCPSVHIKNPIFIFEYLKENNILF